MLEDNRINFSQEISNFENDLNSVLPILITSGVFGFLATATSVVVLVMSKFTSAGDTATLVFIRCLCVSDALIGLSGIFKTLTLINIDILLMNCFLPESLFTSAVSASVFVLFWLSLDSFLHLCKPIDQAFHMDKKNVISGAVVLWNVSFIVGFVPQMGWNDIEYDCLYYHYYSRFYLMFVSLLWLVLASLSGAIQVKNFKIVWKIQRDRHFLTPCSKDYKKYGSMIKTVRIELITWFVCFVPCLLYYVISLAVYGNPGLFPYTNHFLPCLMLVFAFRSFINSIIHGYKAKHVNAIVKQLSRRLSASFRRRQLFNRQSRRRNHGIINIQKHQKQNYSEDCSNKCPNLVAVETNLSRHHICNNGVRPRAKTEKIKSVNERRKVQTTNATPQSRKDRCHGEEIHIHGQCLRCPRLEVTSELITQQDKATGLNESNFRVVQSLADDSFYRVNLGFDIGSSDDYLVTKTDENVSMPTEALPCPAEPKWNSLTVTEYPGRDHINSAGSDYDGEWRRGSHDLLLLSRDYLKTKL